jgi:hypothetical protein
VVLYEATPADVGWDEHRLRGLLPRGLGWDAPLSRGARKQSGAKPGGTFEFYKHLLSRYRWAILENVYREVVAGCRARGVRAMYVLIPRVGSAADRGDRDRLLGLARRCGFWPVIDLSDRFAGIDPEGLAIAPEDYHPNARGHALVARGLEAAVAAEVDRAAQARPTPDPDAESRAVDRR